MNQYKAKVYGTCAIWVLVEALDEESAREKAVNGIHLKELSHPELISWDESISPNDISVIKL